VTAVESTETDEPSPSLLVQELLDVSSRPWAARAACRGLEPELFFPARGASTREAKAVCAVCPVRAECLEDALEHHEGHGIWGGMSERERRRIRSKRALERRQRTREMTA
jgi:WhiB family redox-sensing transcriptional regulator